MSDEARKTIIGFTGMIAKRSPAEAEALCKGLSDEKVANRWRLHLRQFVALHGKYGHKRHKVTREEWNKSQLYWLEKVRREWT